MGVFGGRADLLFHHYEPDPCFRKGTFGRREGIYLGGLFGCVFVVHTAKVSARCDNNSGRGLQGYAKLEASVFSMCVQTEQCDHLPFRVGPVDGDVHYRSSHPMTGAIPLRALVARADRAADIVAPQYDSLPSGGRYGYAIERPDCFLNVTLSAGDFPEPVPHPSTIARRAADHFGGMLDRGLFEPLPAEAFFLYELDTGHHRQMGIVAGIPTTAITSGQVLGHEGTIKERVDDLAGFFHIARLASSPVALGFRADEIQSRLMERLSARPPIRDFTGPDGVHQRLWMIDDPADIADVGEATARIGAMYITDGHHRVAASCREGVAPGWFLAILFPADRLRALEYNRSVRLRRAVSPEYVAKKLGDHWEMTELGPVGDVDAQPRNTGEISMLWNGVWHRLVFRGELPADPVERLDVSLLHDLILGPVFGISSYEDPRLAFVVGEDAVMRLERRRLAYPGSVGFALYPAPIEETMAVADAGRLMPPKSTWFTPKPRSGLLVVRWSQSDVSVEAPAP